MALITRAHKQLQAAKLGDFLTSCPLVLIYQTLGNVRSSGLADAINEEMKKASLSSELGLHAKSLKVKNTIASSTRGTSLAPFFQASNILVGWEAPAQGPPVKRTAKRESSLADMLGDLASASSPSLSTKLPHIPHARLAQAIGVSLKLPKSQPVALLASFYRGQHFRLAHLKEWISLDESKVMPALLSELDSPSLGLCSSVDAPLDALMDTLDSLGPADLLDCLDAVGRQQPTAA